MPMTLTNWCGLFSLPSVCRLDGPIAEVFLHPEEINPTFWDGKPDHDVLTGDLP